MLSLKQCCVYVPNYWKNVTEVMKDLGKHITAIDALAIDPFSDWLNSMPSNWKYTLLSIAVFLALLGFCLTFCICQAGPNTIHTSLEMPLLSPSVEMPETRFSHCVRVFHSKIPTL